MNYTPQTDQQAPHRPRRAVRAALWLPGLLVALGAAVATAHGLYEVARAAKAPPLIAALYPLITDGLALVAYAATARLSGSGQRYAWAVVVLAAGLSGLAQASYLAHGVTNATTALRFGVGAWPAIAAAIVAHLLYLIATADHAADTDTHQGASTAIDAPERVEEPAEADAPAAPAVAVAVSEPDEQPTVQLPTVQPDGHCTSPDAVQPDTTGQADAAHPEGVQPVAPASYEAPTESAEPSDPSSPIRSVPSRPAQSPARDRAAQTAKAHRAEHGDLPTVARLMELADVSRGTAGEALKTVRSQPAELHLVHQPAQQEAHS